MDTEVREGTGAIFRVFSFCLIPQQPSSLLQREPGCPPAGATESKAHGLARWGTGLYDLRAGQQSLAQKSSAGLIHLTLGVLVCQMETHNFLLAHLPGSGSEALSHIPAEKKLGDNRPTEPSTAK